MLDLARGGGAEGQSGGSVEGCGGGGGRRWVPAGAPERSGATKDGAERQEVKLLIKRRLV